ncbi:hypothetical protein [Prosthecomicrobium hirschii]|uniref:hypothetical protein n=1 Tax=Prosthecodimorpha hirschii TaxID=665126 RepID=UPI00221F1F85|nr:hypothetical protein [Prosthecomicrobium hirschii]MCW1839476.1 hypothetical protein [Prosthecomicrobium hirschii]
MIDASTMTMPRDRGVVPFLYCDESSVAPRATPDDWLVRDDEAGGWRLAPSDPDDDEPKAGPLLVEGEIEIFARVLDYGRATLKIESATLWSVDRPQPPGAALVWVPGDPDTMADSVESLVEALAPGQPETIEIEYYSVTDSGWVFEAETGSFRAVTP